MVLILLGIVFLVIIFTTLFEVIFPSKHAFKSEINIDVDFAKVKEIVCNLHNVKKWHPLYLNEALGLEIIEGFSQDGKMRTWHIPRLPSSGVMQIAEETGESIRIEIELFEEYSPKRATILIYFVNGLFVVRQTYFAYPLKARLYARKGALRNEKNINLACKNILNLAKI